MHVLSNLSTTCFVLVRRNRRFVGAKTLDAGDIIQTLTGWTVIGGGTSALQRRLPFSAPKRDFRDKMSDTSRSVHAMDQAISELSMPIDPADVGRAPYLSTAPAKEMTMQTATFRSSSVITCETSRRTPSIPKWRLSSRQPADRRNYRDVRDRQCAKDHRLFHQGYRPYLRDEGEEGTWLSDEAA